MIKYFKKALLISLFLLLPSLGLCDELMKVRVSLFDGGQNSADLASIINSNQGTFYKNVVLNRKGQLFKRKGQSLFASDESNTAWTGIGIFNPDVNTQYILAASGTSVIRSTDSGANASWTIVNPNNALTAGKNTEFLQANNLFFILNGYDYTAAYDGSSWDPGSSSTASPPIGTTAVWLQNYFFVAGNETNPDWIYFSNNLAPRTFTSTDVRKVNTGDGQKIVRLEPFKLNELIVYKEKSIFILDISDATPSNWTLQPVSTSIGCAALRSVVNIGNDHWFLSSEPFAIRSLIRTSFDKLLIDMVSQPIQDIFDGTGEITLNKTQVRKACAILFDNKYIIAIPTDTSTINNTVLVYDFIVKAWYMIDGWYPAAWQIFNNNLYYIDALDGRIIKCFTNNIGDMASGPITTASSEPTVAITWEYRSKQIDFDNPENFKKLDALEVEFEAIGNYDVDVYINLDSVGWQNVGTINLTGDMPTLPNTLPISLTSVNIVRKTFQLQQYGEFKKMQVRFVQDDRYATVNLHNYTIFSFLKPWRRE